MLIRVSCGIHNIRCVQCEEVPLPCSSRSRQGGPVHHQPGSQETFKNIFHYKQTLENFQKIIKALKKRQKNPEYF